MTVHEFQRTIEHARASGQIDQLIELLAEDVVFRSPVVHKPYHGRAVVAPLLRAVVRVFDEFSFHRQIGGADGADHAFVFRARIGNREIEGCDFVHTDHRGLIDEFYVMVRPLSGAMALADAMQRQLALQSAANA